MTDDQLAVTRLEPILNIEADKLLVFNLFVCLEGLVYNFLKYVGPVSAVGGNYLKYV